MLNRTILALWKARSLSPEQKVQIVEESEAKSLQSEESGAFLGIEDVTMSEVYSSVLPVPVSSAPSLSPPCLCLCLWEMSISMCIHIRLVTFMHVYFFS